MPRTFITRRQLDPKLVWQIDLTFWLALAAFTLAAVTFVLWLVG